MEYIITKNKRLINFFIVCVNLIFFTSLANGAQNLLELHSGTVKLLRNGKSQILQEVGKTYPLFASDKIQTGKNTRVSLFLKDKANTVKLFSQSFFKLEELSNEADSVSLLTGKGNFNVKPLEDSLSEKNNSDEKSENLDNLKGQPAEDMGKKFKGSFEKLGETKILKRKKRFSIRTVSAIVGVRGTEFIVGTTDGSTKVLGNSGEVTLASPEIPEYEVALEANQASHINEGSGPSLPVNVPAEERDKITSSDSVESFNEVEFGPSELISTIQERLKDDDETPRFQEEQDREGRFLEQIDRLEELESLVDNAENAISSAKQKIFVFNMTFTER